MHAFLSQLLADALATEKHPRYSDARPVVREMTQEDMELASTSQALAKCFAEVSKLEAPKVWEPIDLLWRNAARARDERGN